MPVPQYIPNLPPSTCAGFAIGNSQTCVCQNPDTPCPCYWEVSQLLSGRIRRKWVIERGLGVIFQSGWECKRDLFYWPDPPESMSFFRAEGCMAPNDRKLPTLIVLISPTSFYSASLQPSLVYIPELCSRLAMSTCDRLVWSSLHLLLRHNSNAGLSESLSLFLWFAIPCPAAVVRGRPAICCW